MIDQKKIEEAAEKQIETIQPYSVEERLDRKEPIFLYEKNDVLAMFKSGINWFLDNLWHDASEEPEEKNILIEFPNGNCYACYRSGNYYKTPNISDDRYDIIDAKDITRWLYIEDLMKGGK